VRAVTTYVALLRGINVGGRTQLAMDDLRQRFVDLGHADVRTYLRTGNVIFRSDGRSQASAAAIEERIARDLGMRVTVLLRTAADLEAIVAGSPFLEGGRDASKLHVTFLADAPAKERPARLDTRQAAPDEAEIVGREVYLHCPNGYGRTKLSNAFLERHLGVAATTRTWRTVTSLRDLARG